MKYKEGDIVIFQCRWCGAPDGRAILLSDPRDDRPTWPDRGYAAQIFTCTFGCDRKDDRVVFLDAGDIKGLDVVEMIKRKKRKLGDEF